jgi:hypothetical protein
MAHNNNSYEEHYHDIPEFINWCLTAGSHGKYLNCNTGLIEGVSQPVNYTTPVLTLPSPPTSGDYSPSVVTIMAQNNPSNPDFGYFVMWTPLVSANPLTTVPNGFAGTTTSSLALVSIYFTYTTNPYVNAGLVMSDNSYGPLPIQGVGSQIYSADLSLTQYYNRGKVDTSLLELTALTIQAGLTALTGSIISGIVTAKPLPTTLNESALRSNAGARHGDFAKMAFTTQLASVALGQKAFEYWAGQAVVQRTQTQLNRAVGTWSTAAELRQLNQAETLVGTTSNPGLSLFSSQDAQVYYYQGNVDVYANFIFSFLGPTVAPIGDGINIYVYLYADYIAVDETITGAFGGGAPITTRVLITSDTLTVSANGVVTDYNLSISGFAVSQTTPRTNTSNPIPWQFLGVSTVMYAVDIATGTAFADFTTLLAFVQYEVNYKTYDLSYEHTENFNVIQVQDGTGPITINRRVSYSVVPDASNASLLNNMLVDPQPDNVNSIVISVLNAIAGRCSGFTGTAQDYKDFCKAVMNYGVHNMLMTAVKGIRGHSYGSAIEAAMGREPKIDRMFEAAPHVRFSKNFLRKASNTIRDIGHFVNGAGKVASIAEKFLAEGRPMYSATGRDFYQQPTGRSIHARTPTWRAEPEHAGHESEDDVEWRACSQLFSMLTMYRPTPRCTVKKRDYHSWSAAPIRKTTYVRTSRCSHKCPSISTPLSELLSNSPTIRVAFEDHLEGGDGIDLLDETRANQLFKAASKSGSHIARQWRAMEMDPDFPNFSDFPNIVDSEDYIRTGPYELMTPIEELAPRDDSVEIEHDKNLVSTGIVSIANTGLVPSQEYVSGAYTSSKWADISSMSAIIGKRRMTVDTSNGAFFCALSDRHHTVISLTVSRHPILEMTYTLKNNFGGELNFNISDVFSLADEECEDQFKIVASMAFARGVKGTFFIDVASGYAGGRSSLSGNSFGLALLMALIGIPTGPVYSASLLPGEKLGMVGGLVNKLWGVMTERRMLIAADGNFSVAVHELILQGIPPDYASSITGMLSTQSDQQFNFNDTGIFPVASLIEFKSVNEIIGALVQGAMRDVIRQRFTFKEMSRERVLSTLLNKFIRDPSSAQEYLRGPREKIREEIVEGVSRRVHTHVVEKKKAIKEQVVQPHQEENTQNLLIYNELKKEMARRKALVSSNEATIDDLEGVPMEDPLKTLSNYLKPQTTEKFIPYKNELREVTLYQGIPGKKNEYERVTYHFYLPILGPKPDKARRKVTGKKKDVLHTSLF